MTKSHNNTKNNSSKKHTKKHSKKHGSTKKAGKWIEHVKQYAKEHNIKFGDALKEAAKTYKK